MTYEQFLELPGGNSALLRQREGAQKAVDWRCVVNSRRCSHRLNLGAQTESLGSTYEYGTRKL